MDDFDLDYELTPPCSPLPMVNDHQWCDEIPPIKTDPQIHTPFCHPHHQPFGHATGFEGMSTPMQQPPQGLRCQNTGMSEDAALGMKGQTPHLGMLRPEDLIAVVAELQGTVARLSAHQAATQGSVSGNTGSTVSPTGSHGSTDSCQHGPIYASQPSIGLGVVPPHVMPVQQHCVPLLHGSDIGVNNMSQGYSCTAGGRAMRKRKHEDMQGMSSDTILQIRKDRNRESAQLSRDRKKARLEMLESNNVVLATSNTLLQNQIQTKDAENAALKAQIRELEELLRGNASAVRGNGMLPTTMGAMPNRGIGSYGTFDAYPHAVGRPVAAQQGIPNHTTNAKSGVVVFVFLFAFAFVFNLSMFQWTKQQHSITKPAWLSAGASNSQVGGRSPASGLGPVGAGVGEWGRNTKVSAPPSMFVDEVLEMPGLAWGNRERDVNTNIGSLHRRLLQTFEDEEACPSHPNAHQPTSSATATPPPRTARPIRYSPSIVVPRNSGPLSTPATPFTCKTTTSGLHGVKRDQQRPQQSCY